MDGRVSKLELELLEVQSRLLKLENCFANLNEFQNKTTKGTEEDSVRNQNSKTIQTEVCDDDENTSVTSNGVESNQEDFLEDVVYKIEVDADEDIISGIKVEHEYEELLDNTDNNEDIEDPRSLSDDRSQPTTTGQSISKDFFQAAAKTGKFSNRNRLRTSGRRPRKNYPPLTIPQREEIPSPPHVSLTSLTKSELGRYWGLKNKKYQDNLQKKLRLMRSMQIYNCYFCSFKTKIFQNLCGHISAHTKEGPMKDNPGQTEQGSKLMHTFYTGVGERPFHCPHCPYTGVAEHNLYAHMKYNHPEIPNDIELSKTYICNFCPYVPTTQSRLHRHIKLKHKRDYINCYFCPYRTKVFRDLVRHVAAHTREHPYKCPLCPHSTRWKYQLNGHMQIHKHPKQSTKLKSKIRKGTGERPYHCPHCPYTGKTKGSMASHINYKHPENPKWEVCKICSKECRYSKNSKELRSHMRVHEEKPKDVNIPKDFILCNFCPYITTTQSSLNTHIKLMHEGDDSDYIKCYFCTYRTKMLNLLVRHFRIHTGETPYKCPHCPHATRDFKQLRNHTEQIHPADTTGRDFKCSKCPTTFKNERDLNIHVRLHGTNAFKCPMCPDLQPFLSSSILRQHRRKMHPKGGLNYECPHCSKKFKQKQQLEYHVHSHTGERPYKCDKCSYGSARPGNLSKHKKLCKGKERKDEIEVECDECGQKFTNEGNVKRHKSKLHPKKKEALKC